MYLLLIYLPIFSSFFCAFFGRFIGKVGVFIISLICIGLSLLISLLLFYEVIFSGSNCYIILFDWINIDFLSISWGFLFDGLTCSMLFIVLFISFLVHIYSIEYMANDPHIKRFISYLSLFTFFMIILVTADNFLQMFLGWEGVGLVSYLLINFWFMRIEANKAAIKAMLINKVGDLSVIIAMLFMLYYFKSLNYNVIFSIAYLFNNETLIYFDYFKLSVIGFFIFIGVVGKSAQLGLHTWLPDAMEGPTPVSALIHAATMVTAGVFLIIRCSPILEYTPNILLLIMIIGGLTTFFAASIGLFQYDLKKVIAYSTCSQLGYMVFACGLSNYLVSLFHLVNHAFFKALLFLTAGSIIHSLYNEQDMRKYGGLINILPFAYVCMMIGSLALIGFPFLSGFYSKDIILELIFVNYSINGLYIYWLAIIAASFTAFYSFRLLYMTFFAKPNNSRIIYLKVHQNSYIINGVLFILVIFSIFWGFFMKDLFIGLGNNFTNNAIFILPSHYTLVNSEFLNIFIKHLPFFFSILGIFICFYFNFYFKEQIFNYKYNNYFIQLFYKFFIKKWYFDYIYNKIFVKYCLNYSYLLFKNIDRGLLEKIGPVGIIRFFRYFSWKVNKWQTGYVYHYLFVLFIFLIFFIFISQFYFNINTFLISIILVYFLFRF